MGKSLFFISFEEAQRICDKSQYNEATGWDKFKLNLRYFWCRFTRKYIKQNQKLTKTIESANLQCLRPCELEELKKDFESELQNQ